MKTVETKSVGRGQKLVTATGRDDSSFPVNDGEARNGKEMKGGIDNISHSLSGASAVQGHGDGKK